MSDNIAYFKKGVLVDVYPRNRSLSLYDDRGNAYCATAIVSDGRKYNLLDPHSVAALPCPRFSSGGGSVTLSLDYILRMCASNIRNAGANEQSIMVLWKAVQLMPHSGIGWSEKDYLRLAAWLYEDGRITDGDRVEHYIRNNREIQFDANIQNVAIRNFQNASQNGLVRYDNFGGICCEICAKYSGRVYRTSWTWSNRKFPKLPSFLAECGCWHLCCNTSVSPFKPGWDDTVYYRGKRIKLAEAQNRPYTDERTESEKLQYEETLAKINKENNHLAQLREYHLLRINLPDGMMPKSLSAYSRIKNANTDKYQQIQSEAKRLGLIK